LGFIRSPLSVSPGLLEVSSLSAPDQQIRQEHGQREARNESALPGSWLREPDAGHEPPSGVGDDESGQGHARQPELAVVSGDQPSQPPPDPALCRR
jgi:hypothetical protein